MKHNAIAIHVGTQISALAIMTVMFGTGGKIMAQANTSEAVKNVVLVHGGLVDGSGWMGVYKALTFCKLTGNFRFTQRLRGPICI
jgi:transketolase N-terminal domain/subunit